MRRTLDSGQPHGPAPTSGSRRWPRRGWSSGSSHRPQLFSSGSEAWRSLSVRARRRGDDGEHPLLDPVHLLTGTKPNSFLPCLEESSGEVYGGTTFHECKSYSELDGSRCNRVRCCDCFDWRSSIVWQFGNACRLRQHGPLCALVQFSRRLCLYRSWGGPSAAQALGRPYLTVRCGFHNPRLCGIWRSRYRRWGIRETDHRRADN